MVVVFVWFFSPSAQLSSEEPSKWRGLVVCMLLWLFLIHVVKHFHLRGKRGWKAGHVRRNAPPSPDARASDSPWSVCCR